MAENSVNITFLAEFSNITTAASKIRNTVATLASDINRELFSAIPRHIPAPTLTGTEKIFQGLITANKEAQGKILDTMNELRNNFGNVVPKNLMLPLTEQLRTARAEGLALQQALKSTFTADWGMPKGTTFENEFIGTQPQLALPPKQMVSESISFDKSKESAEKFDIRVKELQATLQKQVGIDEQLITTEGETVDKIRMVTVAIRDKNAAIKEGQISGGAPTPTPYTTMPGFQGGEEVVTLMQRKGQTTESFNSEVKSLMTTLSKYQTQNQDIIMEERGVENGLQKVIIAIRQKNAALRETVGVPATSNVGMESQKIDTITQALSRYYKVYQVLTPEQYKNAAFMGKATLAAQKQTAAFNKQYGTSMELSNGIVSLGKDQYALVANLKAVEAQTKRGILGFKSLGDSVRQFGAQVLHYITFSVGVQMVMQLRQGIQGLIDNFKQFQQAAVNATAVTGYMGSGFEAVSKHIMDLSKSLGKKTLYNANQVAEAFYDLASAGYDIGEMTEQNLLPILQYATATQVELKDATYSVATALTSFGLEFEDTQRVVDVFTQAINSSFLTFDRLKAGMEYVGPTAGAMGIELEEAVASLAALTDRGMEGAAAGQRLNMIFTKFLDPTKEASDALAELGLTIDDVNPEIYTFTEILYKLRNAGFGAAQSSEIFRSRTASAAMTLVDNADEVARYVSELENAKGVTAAVAELQESTLLSAFKKSENAIHTAGLEIAESMAPGLMAMADGMKDLVPTLRAIGGVLSFLVKNLKGLLQILSFLLPMWMTLKFVQIATNSATAIGIGLSKLKVALLGAEAVAQQAVNVKTSEAIVLHNALNKSILANPWALIAALAVGSIFAITAALTVFKDATEYTLKSFREFMGITSGDQFDDFTGDINRVNLALFELINTVQKTQKFKIGLPDHNITLYEWGAETGNLEKEMKSVKLTRDEYVKLYDTIAGKGAFDKRFKYDLERLKEIKPPEVDMGDTDSIMNYIKYWHELGVEFMALDPEKKKSIVLDNQQWAITSKLSPQILKYQVATENLDIALKEEKKAKEELTELNKAAKLDIEAYADAQVKVAYATEKTRKAIADEMGAIKGYLTAIRGVNESQIRVYKSSDKAITDEKGEITQKEAKNRLLSQNIGILDEVIGEMENYASIQNQIQELEREHENALTELSNTTIEYAAALNTFGSNSKEALRAYAALESATRDLSENETELAEKNSTLTISKNVINSYKEYGKAIQHVVDEGLETEHTVTEYAMLTSNETELLTFSQDLLNSRELLADATTNASLAEAEYNALLDFTANILKFTSEKLKNYFEMQEKVYEIEYKLYKLKNDQAEGEEELFDALAEEGMLTEDMIGAYTELEKAQGGVQELNFEYTKAVEKLNANQYEEYKAFMASKKGTKEYDKALRDLIGSGAENVDIIVRYKDAQDRLSNAVANFRTEVLPTIERLKETGAISEEVYRKFLDLIEIPGQIAEGEAELATATLELDDAFVTLMDNTTRMAKSLQVLPIDLEKLGEEELKNLDLYIDSTIALQTLDKNAENYTDTVKDQAEALAYLQAHGYTTTQLNSYIDTLSSIGPVYKDLIKKMGLAETIGEDEASILETLNAFYSTNAKSLSEFSDEDLILAATMIEAGKAMNQFKKDMKMEDLQKILGIENIDVYRANLTGLLSDQQTGYDLQAEQLKTTKAMTAASIAMTNAINKLSRAFLGMNENVFKSAMSLDGASIFLETFGGDANKMLDWMDDMGFDFDMSWMSSWDGDTFDEFYSDLTGTRKQQITDALNSISSESGIDVTQTWNGELWEKFKSDNILQLNDLFTAMQAYWDAHPIIIYQDIVTDEGTGGAGGKGGGGGGGGGAVPGGGSEGEPYKPGEGAAGYVKSMTNPTKATGTVTSTSGLIKRWDFKNNLNTYLMKKKVGDYLGWAKGGIVAGPQLSMIGEAGKEAIIPLQGLNKKYGKQILMQILPKYFPDMVSYKQQGGIVGGGGNDYSSNINENFNIMGPINVNAIANAGEFSEQLKFRMRASG